ncbi:PREDICTED: probable proline--tRNA ligase, mitochondrial [Nicrophorus vespilloides]|uniref:proline--tRNA ligase n=1 Tax=Nicrophorus vespilloides TaxID=110193 RepID=A0ABM1N5W3_NICVS|nr:PREDICTED: probable proline--tRNA ligase, mitochondrial [Nicrophorus vespilloides]
MNKIRIVHRSSRLFQPLNPVQKNIQAKNVDLTSLSQKLMLDLGIIKQSSPGSFHYLPLAVRSLNKLTKIVDEEMANIDAQKVIFPTLTYSKLWEKTGRISDVDSELFKVKDRHDGSYILSPTHEEAAADLLATITPMSYKQFPLKLYQISSKFRDEMKPRFGLMRARQFIMKDLYSFDLNMELARATYDQVCEAYERIFKLIGINFVKVLGTTGNMGGSISNEFHFISKIGEDKILSCGSCGYRANVELAGDELQCPVCGNNDKDLIKNGIEVGHTFLLGEKYSKPLNANFMGINSNAVALQMGSYGLGISRILAAAIEVGSLEHEIRWPDVLAPYSIIIISPKDGSKEDSAVKDLPLEMYRTLDGVFCDEVLLDDRNALTIGKRVLDAKRTGYPYIVVVGSKATETPARLEVIDVKNDEQHYLSKDQLVDFLQGNCANKSHSVTN